MSKFDAVVISILILEEAKKRVKNGLHNNLAQAIYEVYGEIGIEVGRMMDEANIEEREQQCTTQLIQQK